MLYNQSILEGVSCKEES